MPDISGINPALPIQNLRMTIGENTINYAQHRAPFSGVVNTSTVTSPTMVSISGKFDNRFDDPRYYVGDNI